MRERRGRGLTTTTTTMPAMVVGAAGDGGDGGGSSAAVTPGHDSRAPVFEYNALYCPRHIIYLPVK